MPEHSPGSFGAIVWWLQVMNSETPADVSL
jgi:hypothetical protein